MPKAEPRSARDWPGKLTAFVIRHLGFVILSSLVIPSFVILPWCSAAGTRRPCPGTVP
jgi:hypothetical protein